MNETTIIRQTFHFLNKPHSHPIPLILRKRTGSKKTNKKLLQIIQIMRGNNIWNPSNIPVRSANSDWE